MSKYFTKYLPAKGHFHYAGAVIQRKKDGALATVKRVGEGLDETEWDHVKLFLCSRDIQVGDKYLDQHGDTITHTTGEIYSTDYKVIGPISPEATWVTEGMDFEEDDWLYCVIHITGGWTRQQVPKDHIDTLNKQSFSPGIIIKGPCGHFH